MPRIFNPKSEEIRRANPTVSNKFLRKGFYEIVVKRLNMTKWRILKLNKRKEHYLIQSISKLSLYLK